MKVVVRTDASRAVGTGHVMRSLTLAHALRERNATVLFICREHNGHLCHVIEQQGFMVRRLPVLESGSEADDVLAHAAWLGATWQQDAAQTRAAIHSAAVTADWLVVDHYALDRRWESTMRASATRICVIDDLADRPHDCDVLLDQNHHTDDTRYDTLIPSRCTELLGPRYALLRQEFADARNTSRQRDGTVCRVLVSFGGTDATVEITKTLQAIEALGVPFTVDVVFGAEHPQGSDVVTHYSRCSWLTFHERISNMAEMMAKADLCVGAAGGTTWERCCLGVPSIIISVARNQDAIAIGCEQAGACFYLGRRDEVSSTTIADALQRAISDHRLMADMSVRAARLADGRGAQRVAAAMQG